MSGRDSDDQSGTVALVDLVNRVMDRGIVISGDVIISVADVDLIYLKLSLLLSSVETLRGGEREVGAAGTLEPVPTSDARPMGAGTDPADVG